MTKGPAILILLMFCCLNSDGQQTNYNPGKKTDDKKVKGWLYGSFGWHRIYFTRSTIHFRNTKAQNYDFTLYKVRGRDDNDLNIGKGIDAPQWSLRLGYLFNHRGRYGIELSYDHAKYVMREMQQVHMKGTINSVYYDKDTSIYPDFLEYEHTDGANYYMLSLVKRNNLYTGKKGRRIDLLCKAGAGPVIPRTDSKIMGYHYNDRYHISGYVAGAEGNFRWELLKNFFAELSIKGAYANYSDVLLYGGGRAKQHWWSLQSLFTIVYQVTVRKNK
ncbi:MAG: hypothetical protein HZB42_03780 [Sphingobacteriales bacterium]|nr:hypothetical protein [Sphingobacteriales bacterium]